MRKENEANATNKIKYEYRDDEDVKKCIETLKMSKKHQDF